jgi:hypothetical protein
MNKKKLLLYVTLGQLIFISFLWACYLIHPDIVDGPGGFSNYGVMQPTIFLYSGAFLGAGSFTLAGARQLSDKPVARRYLVGLGVGYFVILLSTYPYQLHAVLNYTHTTLGTLFFGYILFLSSWLLRIAPKHLFIMLGAVTLSTGALMGLLSLPAIVDLLSQAQAIFTVGFAILLIAGVNQMTKEVQATV